MTQRTISYEKLDEEFIQVNVDYNRQEMKRYWLYHWIDQETQRKVVTFYTTKQDYSEILSGTKNNLSVAFRQIYNRSPCSPGGVTRPKTVCIRPITRPEILESIVGEIREQKKRI